MNDSDYDKDESPTPAAGIELTPKEYSRLRTALEEQSAKRQQDPGVTLQDVKSAIAMPGFGNAQTPADESQAEKLKKMRLGAQKRYKANQPAENYNEPLSSHLSRMMRSLRPKNPENDGQDR